MLRPWGCTDAFAESDVPGCVETSLRDCCSIWSNPRLMFGRSGRAICAVSCRDAASSDERSAMDGAEAVGIERNDKRVRASVDLQISTPPEPKGKGLIRRGQRDT